MESNILENSDFLLLQTGLDFSSLSLLPFCAAQQTCCGVLLHGQSVRVMQQANVLDDEQLGRAYLWCQLYEHQSVEVAVRSLAFERCQKLDAHPR